MRDFVGIPYASLPEVRDPDFTYRLKSMLAQIDLFGRDASQGFALIQGGFSPVGGGTTPLVDLSNFFYLPGRSGGQVAYGDVVDSGTLTLSSSSSSTKGKIYLGSAQTQAAFDEALGFLSLGNVAPNALLHLTSTGTFINMENSSFDIAVSAVSGDSTLTTAAGFTPADVGGTGPSVTPGMTVSGTGITAGTTVLHVDSNTELWLSAPTTGTISAANVTFTPNALFKQTSDETGRDIDLLMKGVVRMTTGVGTAPLRFVGDNITGQSSLTTNLTISCTAPAGIGY